MGVTGSAADIDVRDVVLVNDCGKMQVPTEHGRDVVTVLFDNFQHAGLGDFVGGNTKALLENCFLAHRQNRHVAGDDDRPIFVRREVFAKQGVPLFDRLWTELRCGRAGIIGDDEAESLMRKGVVAPFTEDLAVGSFLCSISFSGVIVVIPDCGAVGDPGAIDQFFKRDKL